MRTLCLSSFLRAGAALALAGVLAAACGGNVVVEAPDCAPGEIACDGECANPENDEDHCGGCDMTCPVESSCVAGSCVQGCVGCGTFITSSTPPVLCDVSQALYDALVLCLCEQKCADVCQGLCVNEPIDLQCEQCLNDVETGCGAEFEACSNNG